MKVVTLLENRSIAKELKHNHGLSLYIETDQHKVLFDTGANDYFADNASSLGVNLKDVDILIISHGHYDHGGGLEKFLEINDRARIYIGKEAFEKHIVKLLGLIKYDIGLNQELENNDRFIVVDGTLEIDDELTIFNQVTGNKLMPSGNRRLLKDKEGHIGPDDFNHEINLLVNQNGGYHLYCGCAHKGIVNIIAKARELVQQDLKTVIGGFHLKGIKLKKQQNQLFLEELAEALDTNGTESYYTCHCTGESAYHFLSEKMDQLQEIRTGTILDV